MKKKEKGELKRLRVKSRKRGTNVAFWGFKKGPTPRGLFVEQYSKNLG